MKKIMIIMFLCTGYVWGQGELTSKKIKNEIHSINMNAQNIIEENHVILHSYVDSIFIQDTEIINFVSENFVLLETLESRLKDLALYLEANDVKKRDKYKEEIRVSLLNLYSTQKTQRDFFSRRLKN